MKNKKKTFFLKIFSILFIVVGLIIILFPHFTNWLYDNEVKSKKEDFIDKISQSETDSNEENSNNNEKESNEENSNNVKVQELYEELKRRNEELYKNKQTNLKDPFSYEQPSIDLNEYGLEGNTIGFINIPKLKVELPILLGANEQNMKKGAVHLTETSYPIGGENTNPVIAAHRGWSKSQMFRNIQKLEIGDEIQIQNFKEKLTYKVFDIKIISPTDIEKLLIQDGKDIVTLVTCHPYRVNTQRYVVYCERIND